MGFRTEVDPLDVVDGAGTAARLRRETEATTQSLRRQMPRNRDLIRKIRDYGLQTI